jgi:hypothetical protein
MSSAGEAASTAASQIDEVSGAADKLPSDIKLNLDVTSIQANTAIGTEALQTFDSIITATSKNIGELFGLLVSNPDSPFVDQLLEQIERENELREEQAALFKEYVELWMGYLEAKTEALKKDDALIKIDGAGLQPHLEAFMWEILSPIQGRVNEEGLELLVGL